jgi:hypothetical protein
MKVLIAIAIALLVLLIVAALAYAGEPNRTAWNDKKRGDWFSSLKQPSSGISCCDVSDCKATDAQLRGDQWWAVVRGQWKLIPPEKVLSHPLSIDGDAYVCASPNGDPKFATVYCFIKPIPGY